MEKKEFYLPSTNGKDRLHTVLWFPDNKIPIKAIVQISHGMIEYVNRYDRFASFLTDRGFIVIGNDHLGHGKTAAADAELGYMHGKDGSAVIVADLHQVSAYVRDRYPEYPLFLLGHSMGSFLARRYAMTYVNELQGLLVLGTAYQPIPVLLGAYTVMYTLRMIYGEKHRSRFLTKLAFGVYNAHIPQRVSENAWVTRDEAILQAYDQDKYCTFQFTIKGYQTLFDTLWYIQKKKNVKRIPTGLPMFFAAGEEDPVGQYAKGVKRVIREYRAAGIIDLESHFYPGARHELLNELEYERTQEDIYNWLVKKI